MRLVLCNCPEESAETIARSIVERRLAACVNALPNVTSTYRWEGEICVEKETTLLIKTRSDLIDALTEFIVSIHPAEVPEVIALPILEGHQPYLNWVIDETSSHPEQAP